MSREMRNAIAMVVVVALGLALSWIALRRSMRGALGEVCDYRIRRGLWRLTAGRLVVRERKDGGSVRILYRSWGENALGSCPPAEARRIARALREAARNPLPGRRP